MGKGSLPISNEQGFFEIRLESIGGLGANVAGQIFAEAGVLHAGLNGSNFASYGSEKKGSPVTGFVRFAGGDQEIRDATPIERPHVIGIFHEALLYSGADVLRGLYPYSTVIVNTRKQPDQLATAIGLRSGTLGVLPALDIAVAEGSRVNMAMLGALTKACFFIAPEAVVDAVRASLGVRYPGLLSSNLETFWRGFNEVEFLTMGEPDLGTIGAAGGQAAADRTIGATGGQVAAAAEDRSAVASAGRSPEGADPIVKSTPGTPFIRSAPTLGYATAPIGGVITTPGNSIHRDLSASREGFLPEFLREKCTDCAQCDLVCPDMCFVWEEGVDARGRPAMMLLGIDYQYCKGCLKCVVACPFDALVTIAEADGWAAGQRTAHVWEKPESMLAMQTAGAAPGQMVGADALRRTAEAGRKVE